MHAPEAEGAARDVDGVLTTGLAIYCNRHTLATRLRLIARVRSHPLASDDPQLGIGTTCPAPLITGANPQASDKLGQLAATTLLGHLSV